MKPWQWAVLGLGAIVVIVLISRSAAQPPANGSLNATTAIGSGIGGFLAGLLKSGNKVSAPAGGNIPAGTSGNDAAYGPTTEAQGSAYAAAMQSTGYAASMSAGSGGTNSGGGLTGAQTPAGDPFGLGSLTAPNFNIGTGGADFSN